MMLDERFRQSHYMIRKKIFKLLGDAFHIYDSGGRVLFYSQLKAFKLREDIRVYTGEDKQTEVLVIKARKVLDIRSAYDVVDPTTNERVGVLRRKGLKSIVRDEWLIMDANEQEIGLVQEDNVILALVRRFLTNLVPQSFTGVVHGARVFEFKRHFNPFVLRMDMNFIGEPEGPLDRRLGIAAGVLMSAIEGRQD